jgi:hypothetical protein
MVGAKPGGNDRGWSMIYNSKYESMPRDGLMQMQI